MMQLALSVAANLFFKLFGIKNLNWLFSFKWFDELLFLDFSKSAFKNCKLGLFILFINGVNFSLNYLKFLTLKLLHQAD